MAPASGAPQFAQYLPVPAAPQEGQAVVWSDGEDGEGMRVKLVGRRPVRIDGPKSTLELSEHYAAARFPLRAIRRALTAP